MHVEWGDLQEWLTKHGVKYKVKRKQGIEFERGEAPIDVFIFELRRYRGAKQLRSTFLTPMFNLKYAETLIDRDTVVQMALDLLLHDRVGEILGARIAPVVEAYREVRASREWSPEEIAREFAKPEEEIAPEQIEELLGELQALHEEVIRRGVPGD